MASFVVIARCDFTWSPWHKGSSTEIEFYRVSADMVGAPGRSKGCHTCRRRKKSVR